MAPKGVLDHAMRGKLQHDRKRELDQRHKWSLGEAAQTAGRNKKAPAKPPRSVFTRVMNREVQLSKNKAAQMEKLSRKNDGRYANDNPVSDSSTEEDIREASAAPEPDAGITYSYDAPHGPNKGGHILSMALAKAVEKYETQATDKLIMTEYEVVDNEKEEISTGYAADDSDFELI
ncbi:MAG: hypothetical protein Q9207_001532 [Kuettlingeria erythrocarpa]